MQPSMVSIERLSSEIWDFRKSTHVYKDTVVVVVFVGSPFPYNVGDCLPFCSVAQFSRISCAARFLLDILPEGLIIPFSRVASQPNCVWSLKLQERFWLKTLRLWCGVLCSCKTLELRGRKDSAWLSNFENSNIKFFTHRLYPLNLMTLLRFWRKF